MIRIIEQDKRRTKLAVDVCGRDAVSASKLNIGRATSTDIDVTNEYISISHNKIERKNLATFIDTHNKSLELEELPGDTGLPNSKIVPANHFRVGESINGRTVTHLGKSWYITDADTYSLHNIHPSVTTVQYAYFEGEK